jgi:hypothetical protein
MEHVERQGIPGKRQIKAREASRKYYDSAAKNGFQAGQTAKAQLGPLCAVTPKGHGRRFLFSVDPEDIGTAARR